MLHKIRNNLTIAIVLLFSHSCLGAARYGEIRNIPVDGYAKTGVGYYMGRHYRVHVYPKIDPSIGRESDFSVFDFWNPVTSATSVNGLDIKHDVSIQIEELFDGLVINPKDMPYLSCTLMKERVESPDDLNIVVPVGDMEYIDTEYVKFCTIILDAEIINRAKEILQEKVAAANPAFIARRDAMRASKPHLLRNSPALELEYGRI